MKTTLPPPPTFVQSIQLWLLTNATGTLLLGAWLALRNEYPGDASSLALAGGLVAAALSLPLIGLAGPIFNIILSVKSRPARWLWAFLALTAFWALPNTLLVLALGQATFYSEILALVLPYYAGAVLAGSVVYRSGLFQTTAQADDIPTEQAGNIPTQ